ncbi:MAG: metallophosphoesterase family protein [Methanobrevibacter sp.]|nr:metallophosphoesterase family protein [Methanobrevibacter sp.]MDO5859111.1 metallophosphoesterase family protein [Methanobrevibacter sp.]
MRIGLISDTHISQKRGRLPDRVWEAFDGVDLIIHAGDITHRKVIEELEEISAVVAVLGNNDKLDLNESEVIETESFRIAVNHGTRYSSDFDKLSGLAGKLDADVLVTGHTHRPHCEIIDDVLFINPGSSNRPIKSQASAAILEIDKAHRHVSDIEVTFIEL